MTMKGMETTSRVNRINKITRGMHGSSECRTTRLDPVRCIPIPPTNRFLPRLSFLLSHHLAKDSSEQLSSQQCPHLFSYPLIPAIWRIATWTLLSRYLRVLIVLVPLASLALVWLNLLFPLISLLPTTTTLVLSSLFASDAPSWRPRTYASRLRWTTSRMYFHLSSLWTTCISR